MIMDIGGAVPRICRQDGALRCALQAEHPDRFHDPGRCHVVCVAQRRRPVEKGGILYFQVSGSCQLYKVKAKRRS